MKEIETKIIIDTDIGEDIDDTWALIFLLSSRFVDIKLISVTTGDVKYKAKLDEAVRNMFAYATRFDKTVDDAVNSCEKALKNALK